MGPGRGALAATLSEAAGHHGRRGGGGVVFANARDNPLLRVVESLVLLRRHDVHGATRADRLFGEIRTRLCLDDPAGLVWDDEPEEHLEEEEQVLHEHEEEEAGNSHFLDPVLAQVAVRNVEEVILDGSSPRPYGSTRQRASLYETVVEE